MLRNVLIILAIVFLAILAVKIIIPTIAWLFSILMKIALLALILVAIAFLWKKITT